MRHALPHAARPVRALARLLCAFVVAALPMAGIAYQGVGHSAAAPAAAPGAAAKLLQVEGRVDAIVVTSRVTGQTQRYPVLQSDDGQRYLLKNADALPDGATVAVTGRADGQVLFSDSVRTLAAPPLRKSAVQRKELTGTLRMFHIDYADGRPPEYGYSLVTDSGQKNIVDLGTLLPLLSNGMRATVSGAADASGYITVDTIEILAPPETKPPRVSASTAGAPLALTTGYITLPLKYPNNAIAPFTYNADPASWSIAAITNSVYGVAPLKSVAAYYQEVSFGAQLIGGLVANAGGFWFKANVARPAACSTSAQLDAVLTSIETQSAAQASAAGYNVGSYPGVLYVVDSLPCGWSGLGYIGWERAYAKGTASLGVVGHEFGHNFGLYHAGRLNCGASVIAASGCTVVEYGDPYDIMGNLSSMHFSAYQKDVLGYIPASSVVTHTSGSQTYTLGPIELSGQAQYAVRIPTGNPNRTYWLEFRQPIGFDSALTGSLGAQVRLAQPFENNNCAGCTGLYDDTQFLNVTPLLAGQTYTDSLYNVSFNVTAATSSALAVVVTAGGIAATTTTLASSANPSTLSQNVTFTATVTGSAPTGTVAFRASGIPLAGCGSVALAGAGNTRTATCANSALAVGVHSIVADYSGNATNSTSSSAPLSQTVKTATTTTLASSANPVVAGSSVTFTATVNGSAPTSSVAFTSDGATIAGCGAVNLAGSGNSRTAACTTSALAVGTRAIVASYGGNGGNSPSASTPLSQVVTGAVAVATTTTVTSSANPSALSAPLALTATVVGNPPVTGGSVAFTANGAPVAGCASAPVTAVGGVRTAVCNPLGLTAGAYSIVASYSGNASGQPSASPVFSQVVPFAAIGNTIQFAASAYTVNETAANVVVTVTRIGDVSAPASADYATSGGTATSNVDFTAKSGSLFWPAGDSFPRTIVIAIGNDGVAEASETFTVALSNPLGAAFGLAGVATVTIVDDDSAAASMPGVATVAQNPYGTLSVQGGTQNGNTITNLAKNAVIQLGTVAGSAGSFAEIEFLGLDVGAGNTLTIRSGAPGQTVQLTNVNGLTTGISGTLQAQSGNGAPAPYLVVQNANGLSVNAGGTITGPSGLQLDTLATSIDTGNSIFNLGTIDGGSSLQLWTSRAFGGGRFLGNAMTLATFGNLNNPVNGAHFLANGLQLFPSSGTDVSVTLAGYGSLPQIINLMVNGNATLSMPSAWPNGSSLPPNNRPVMPGEVRAAGVPDPGYGGGSMIIQATGTLALQGGTSGDFVFPGGVVFKSGGQLDVKGTAIDNAWTTTGAAYQGVFLEAPTITDSAGSARIFVRTNNLNWANLSPRPLVPVSTWTLQRLPDGSAQLLAADSAAPHLNFFSITSEAGAAGTCYVCLVNTQVIDFP